MAFFYYLLNVFCVLFLYFWADFPKILSFFNMIKNAILFQQKLFIYYAKKEQICSFFYNAFLILSTGFCFDIDQTGTMTDIAPTIMLNASIIATCRIPKAVNDI